ncbi:MAG: Type pilus biosis/stability protein PilW [Chlorobi bacterium]|nr:Type pilus biosis/stability protein PilW [Chlorobiota bacterium]
MIYFDNGYRVLGLFNGATRGDVWSTFHRARLGRRVEELANPDDPLLRLNARRFAEGDLRDANNALNNVKQRLRERLLWFSNETPADRDAIGLMREGRYEEAAKRWEADPSVDSRANAARIRHMLAMVRDIPALQPGAGQTVETIVGAWKTAMGLWGSLIRMTEFWDHLAAQESRAGFEPIATGDDFVELRHNAWELLLGPSAVMVAELVKGRRFSNARHHLEMLREAGAPQRSITVLETDSFVSVESEVATMCDAILADLKQWSRMHEYRESSLDSAYERYRREVYPLVSKLSEGTGADFGPSRNVCKTAAELLMELASEAQAQRNTTFAQNLARESNAVASGTFTRRITETTTKVKPYSSGRPARSPRGSSGGWRIYWLVKGALIIIYVLGHTGGSSSNFPTNYPDGYRSTYPSSDYPSIDPGPSKRYQRIHANDPGLMEPSYFRAARTEEDRAYVHELVRQDYFLSQRIDSLYAMVDTLDAYRGSVDQHSDTSGRGRRFNIAHIPDTSGSTAVKDKWLATLLTNYRDKWNEFSSRYREYSDTMAAANRNIAALRKSIADEASVFKFMEIDKELADSYNLHKHATAILRAPSSR